MVLPVCQKNAYAGEEEDDEKATPELCTKSLVDSLMSGEGSTFVDLVAGLPKWPDQTPFIAGDHKGDPIWYEG